MHWQVLFVFGFPTVLFLFGREALQTFRSSNEKWVRIVSLLAMLLVMFAVGVYIYLLLFFVRQ